MPRRRVLTDAQLDALLVLPTNEQDLIQHYSLSAQDLAVIMKRRRPHNQLGFALQLCALRFPGCLIRPGELVPIEMARFVAEQLDIDPAALADYATRAQTRYDQLDALRELFGFRSFSQPDRRQLSAWLLPIALTTVSGMAVANALMVELRRRSIAAPGVTVIERMVATALLRAERQVAAAIAGRDLRARFAGAAAVTLRQDGRKYYRYVGLMTEPARLRGGAFPIWGRCARGPTGVAKPFSVACEHGEEKKKSPLAPFASE
jgi:Domain of unknown function (DUF4158)